VRFDHSTAVATIRVIPNIHIPLSIFGHTITAHRDCPVFISISVFHLYVAAYPLLDLGLSLNNSRVTLVVLPP